MEESETAVVNVPLGRMEDEEEYASIYEEIEAGETEGYRVTRTSESVTVAAGTFNAERVNVVGTDEETGESIDADWWRVETVPGETVRFEYRTDEDGTYNGELRRHGTDYRRSL